MDLTRLERVFFSRTPSALGDRLPPFSPPRWRLRDLLRRLFLPSHLERLLLCLLEGDFSSRRCFLDEDAGAGLESSTISAASTKLSGSLRGSTLAFEEVARAGSSGGLALAVN